LTQEVDARADLDRARVLVAQQRVDVSVAVAAVELETAADHGSTMKRTPP
jgi:hypothetical protein